MGGRCRDETRRGRNGRQGPGDLGSERSSEKGQNTKKHMANYDNRSQSLNSRVMYHLWLA